MESALRGVPQNVPCRDWSEMRMIIKDTGSIAGTPSRRFGSVELLPGFGVCPACSKISFLHFGVPVGTPDLKLREHQSGAVLKSTVFEQQRPDCQPVCWAS
jgi:hypothetical protein